MVTKTILTIGDNSLAQKLRDLLGLEVVAKSYNSVSEEDLRGVCLIAFSDGENINPVIYGEEMKGRYKIDTERDNSEIAIFIHATARGIPMLGIGRGAQLLCALNGGKLIQGVAGHEGSYHGLACLNFNTKHADSPFSSDYRTSYTGPSSHSQMMDLGDIEDECRVLGYCDEILSSCNIRGEPEIIHFPNSRSLAIQPHFEWMDPIAPFVLYVVELIITLIENK